MDKQEKDDWNESEWYQWADDEEMSDGDVASELDMMPDPYEELDALYEGVPKFQKIQKSQTPVSDGHNLQRVTENARNRQLKAARKLKEIVREGPVE